MASPPKIRGRAPFRLRYLDVQRRGSGRANQSVASRATSSSAPGSSNRCVAPGTTTSRFSARSAGPRLHGSGPSTARSAPPTISSVGAATSGSAVAGEVRPAAARDDRRHGRRRLGGRATGPRRRPCSRRSSRGGTTPSSGCSRSQRPTPARRPASSGMSKHPAPVAAPPPR